MKSPNLILPAVVALIASLFVSCSSKTKTIPLGTYATANQSESVVLLPDNKIQFVRGIFIQFTADYKVSGDKLAVGGGGQWGDEFLIDGDALVKLGTHERYVRK